MVLSVGERTFTQEVLESQFLFWSTFGHLGVGCAGTFNRYMQFAI